MTSLTLGLPNGIAQQIGWTLIQFLWQGLGFAALMEIALPLCRSPVARHNCALSVLLMMMAAPLAGFFALSGQSGIALPFPFGVDPNAPLNGEMPAPWMAWIVVAWIAGVATMSIRALGGWYLAERLRREGTSAVPALLLNRFRMLQQRLGVSRRVRYMLSPRVTAPVVIGWIRPIILLPVAAITGLPMSQLELLVVHELAHIRRLDPFINLVLIAAETILFYHPAVWWVTRRVRIERENCCDDVSASLCGDAAGYAEALISLYELRGLPSLVVASTGGKLKQRIARLLGTAPQPRKFSLSAMSGVLLVCVIVGSIAAAQVPPRFEIRIVDEAVAANSFIARPGEDRFPAYEPGRGAPSALWLKRQGAIEGTVVTEAHVAAGPDGKPLIQLTLTRQARDRFASLSRANVGKRAAVVINGVVVASPRIKEPMLEGKVQISGNYTQAEANALASQIADSGPRAR